MAQAFLKRDEIRYSFFVGQLSRSTDGLLDWQRLALRWVWLPFVRFCHLRLGLPVTTLLDVQRCPHCQETFHPRLAGTHLSAQAICDTEAVAKAIVAAGGANWFYHRLPVNASLPSEPCKLDGVRFPLSDASKLYEVNGNRSAPVVCPHSGGLCKPHEVINADDIRETARRLKAAASA